MLININKLFMNYVHQLVHFSYCCLRLIIASVLVDVVCNYGSVQYWFMITHCSSWFDRRNCG